MTDDLKVKRLAREFSRLLRKWLTAEQMAEVVKLNKDEKDAGVCHSHDFCDANMAMHEAFINLGYGDPTEDIDGLSPLWNAAWDAAKAENFYESETEEHKSKARSKELAKIVANLFELILTDENHPQHDDLWAELKRRGWDCEQTLKGHLE